MSVEAWSAIANGIMAGAAVVGAYTAVKGVNTWRRQLTWQSDNELSRRILILLFRHRDAIASVRHPAVFQAEVTDAMADVEIELELSNGHRKHLETVSVYERRWAKITEVRSELYPALLEADAVWGSEVRALIDPIYKLELELRMYLQNWFRVMEVDREGSRRAAAEKSLRKKRDVLYDDFSEDDEFNKDYSIALMPLEKFLRDKLGSLRK